MKKHFKTEGVVIRKTDFNEADRIVTVLTDEFGKIDCVAKGARRIKSKFCGRLELFSRVQIACFQGRDLACLNEAHLVSAFADEKDIHKHRILFYIAEITHRLLSYNQPTEGVFSLLTETLCHLENGYKVETLLHAYLIKLLTLTGFLSPWNRCATCSRPLHIDQPILLSTVDANVVCVDCSLPSDTRLQIPFVKWVHFMQNHPLSEALKVQVNKKDHQSVWLWLQGIVENLLNSPVRSERFLQIAA